jgi:tetratricopeptide (TPR) repeat protein
MLAHPGYAKIFVVMLVAIGGCQQRQASEEDQQMSADKIEAGNVLLERGKPAEALDAFDEALQADPASGQAHYSKGCALDKLGRHREAIDAYAQSARLSPDHAALPLYNKGASHEELKEFDKAIEAYRKVTEIDPELADAWTNLGRLQDDQGRHTEAIKCYDEALKIAPHDVVTLTNRGNSLQALERYQEAIACYDRALALDSSDATAQKAKITCLARMARAAK